jgi:hypothetical protein
MRTFSFRIFVALVLATLPRLVSAQELTDVRVHGFLSQGFMMSTANNYLGHSERGSFEFFEVGLNVSKELASDLRVGLQVFAQDLGPIGNFEPFIDWAMVDWRLRPWFGIRAGRIKLPLGLFNETWDVDVTRTPVMLPESVYNPIFRDVLNAVNGASIYGVVDLGAGGELDWNAYTGVVYVPPREGIYDGESLAGGRLLWNTPLAGLRLGGHVLHSNFTLATEVAPGMSVTAEYNNWLQLGASAEYLTGPLTLTAEFRDWSADTEYEPAGIVPGSTYHTDGGYAMAQLQANERLSFSAYYSLSFQDTEDRGNPATFHKDAALGARFDITPEWILKGEGHYIDGTSDLTDDLNPDGRKRRWGLFMAKTSLAF